MDSTNMSRGGNYRDLEVKEFYVKMKISKCSNQLEFLKLCLSEQVLPKSTPIQLRSEKNPFSDSARAYLKDACDNLKYRICELKSELRGVPLSRFHIQKISESDRNQKRNLENKLNYLCSNSKWKDIGRPDIVTNISSRILTNFEKEALSLGLKFDIGVDKKSYLEHVNHNYRWNDDDVDKGFIQGVIACCKALAENQTYAIPMRYVKALIDLGRDNSLVITQADKGGGVVVMDRSDYDNKMMDLINDVTTYEKKNFNYAEEAAKSFNSKVRKILNRNENNKKLLRLLEETPTVPRMRGLPKLHKPNIPMRPITSGIGSAPHRLAKILAKPLTKALGSLSSAHLRNSTDLINRLKNVSFENKKLVSFDVKALFTNVSVGGAMQAIKKVLQEMSDEDLPVNKSDFTELISLCLNFDPFSFNGNIYSQHSGLAMGSPLSCVAACLYMEMLEQEEYIKIIGRGATWVRYVDDVLVIAPTNLNIQQKLERLNRVNERIKFTVEYEKDSELPFLDTLIMRQGRNVKFRVYRKNTNKDDYIHYYSAHSDRIKSGVVIGFYLRAIRICDEEYLKDEMEYIQTAFLKLSYPKGYLIKLRDKAVQISRRSGTERNSSIKEERFVTIPNSSEASIIAEYFKNTSLRIVASKGSRISELTRGNTAGSMTMKENSIVYEIPCSGCNKSYIGESGRGIKQRLREHKADVIYHRTSNAIVVHIEREGHMPRWEGTRILKRGMKKSTRKATEAAYIRLANPLNSRSGFVTWAKGAAQVAVRTTVRSRPDENHPR